ncbi:carbonic anhydrase [Salana multivorans]|nr:carbonic anhydrase [Salana multivorans]OJX98392.1 MAG: carbonic anhydrase [Micrococcales bacterium 73-15]
MTPAEAWALLVEGNERFVSGQAEHPSQSVEHRQSLQASQYPFVVIFGCSDSRLAAELIFDQGLGDAFVVRTAGHVIDTTVIGSIEYGTEILGTPLVVVLGHDSCGAVGAAVDALETGEMPPGFVRAIVDRVIPSILTHNSLEDTERFGLPHHPVRQALLREHVTNTVKTLTAYSQVLADAVAEGRLAVVGAEYTLAEGRARLVSVQGDVGVEPDLT